MLWGRVSARALAKRRITKVGYVLFESFSASTGLMDFEGIIDFSVKICSSVIDNYVAQTAGLNPAQCTATSSGTLSASTASGGIVVASGSAPVTTGTAMHNGTTAATASPTGTGAATNGSSSANSSAATTTPSPSGSNAGSRIAGDIGLAGAIGLALMAL